MKTVHCVLNERELDEMINRHSVRPAREYQSVFFDDISQIEAELDFIPDFYEEGSEVISFQFYSQIDNAA